MVALAWRCVALLLLAAVGGHSADQSTRDVYTFWAELESRPAEHELAAVALWERSWRRAGWTTHVLNESDAQAHPDYAALAAKLSALPSVNSPAFSRATFLRWVAMAATPAGGVLTDYDVLNVGWTAPQPLPAVLTTKERHTPSVVVGSREEFARALALFASFRVPDGGPDAHLYVRRDRPHVSDQVLLRLAAERGELERDHTCVAFGARGGENATLLHFSRTAVVTRGSGLARNELMDMVLHQLTRPTEAEAAERAARAAADGSHPRACSVDLGEAHISPRDAKFFPHLYRGPPGFREAVCDQPVTGRYCYGTGADAVCLPGFVGIGFEKAGTTKMFELLSAHPGVCATARKEAMLMIDVRRWPGQLREQFEGSRADCLHGEFTPFYATPFRPVALPDYLKVLRHLLPPDVRLLAAVRDPVRRAYSHFKYHLERGYDCEDWPGAPCFPKFFRNGTFRNAVCSALNQLGGGAYLDALAARAPDSPYPFQAVNRTVQYPHWDLLSPGFYGAMLRPGVGAVGRERLFVFQQEELEAEPAAVLARAYAFLQLPAFDLAGAVGNATLYSRAKNSLGSRLQLDDRRVVDFLYALYANSTRLTNLQHGTRLSHAPFRARDLDARRLCRHLRANFTGPYRSLSSDQ